MRERSAAHLWLDVLETEDHLSFDDVAGACGLEPLGRGWVELDRQRASEFLTAILHKDLAYKVEVMPEARARWLSEEFVRAFGEHGSRFATNSADLPATFPFQWTPATAFTFDAGVVILGSAAAGLLWVADED
ncbi:MAG: hypothetical protein WAW88_08830 [Nocardioides sp.]